MKEEDLKRLFIESLLSGEIKGLSNEIDLPSHENRKKTIRIKEEAYFKHFDLIIGVISSHDDLPIRTKIESVEEYDRNLNLIMRSSELNAFATEEKCRIDSIDLFPVEFKSDDDSLDERLPNQVINAILAFGRSVLVFDKRHTLRMQNHGTFRLLPATIIGYSDDNKFRVVSSYKKFIVDCLVKPQRSIFAKVLKDNGLINSLPIIYSHINMVQRIYQKMLFNQISREKIFLLNEEIEFLSTIKKNSYVNEKEQMRKLIQESVNYKITEYM
jgi:hypothetical protein